MRHYNSVRSNIPTTTTTIKLVRLGKSSSVTVNSIFALLLLFWSRPSHNSGNNNRNNNIHRYYCSHAFLFVTPTTTTPSIRSSNSNSVSTTHHTATRLTMSSSTSTTLKNKYNAIVKNQKVPGLKHGMDYIQLGDSDLIVSKICCK